MHRTSREGDPQLHTHAVIPNLVCREDGAWVALDATALYRWAKAAGSVYQEELRRRLSDRLGVGWGPDRNGCREMTGLSEAQLRAFSKRTAQIEAHLAATGASAGGPQGPDAGRRGGQRGHPARKDRSLTPEHLRGRWDREAAAVGPARRRRPAGRRDPARSGCRRLVGRSCGRCSTGWSTPRSGCAPMSRASARPRWSRRWRPGGRADSASATSRR